MSNGHSTGNMNPVAALIIMALVILVTAFVVFIERGQRRITINYAKRTAKQEQDADRSTNDDDTDRDN